MDKTLLAQLQHELAVPLTALQSYVEWLQDTDLTEQQAYYVQQLQHAAELSQALIQHHETTLSTRFAPQPFLHDVIAMLRPQCVAKNLQITLKDTASSAEYIEAPALYIQQILLNLLRNALQASTVPGEITLQSCLIKKSKAQGLWQLSISDQGEGMDSATQNLVEQLFQADTITNTFNGLRRSGLGLSIVKALLTRMAASIQFISAPGAGTRVELAIPVAVSTSRDKLTAKAATSFEYPQRILILDDDAFTQIVLQNHLKTTPHLVHAVATNKAAMDFLAENPCNLLITDLQLAAAEDNISWLQFIRELLPQLNIIGMSAAYNSSIQQTLASLNMKTFLQKPYKKKQLLQSILNEKPPVINWQSCRNKLGNNANADKLLAQFMADLKKQQKTIAKLTTPAKQVAWIHRLHGSSAFCGINYLQLCCASTEQQMQRELSTQARAMLLKHLQAVISYVVWSYQHGAKL